MGQNEPKPVEDLIHLADLEWLDLSDLIRMDEDWRRTLVVVSRLHLALIAVLAALVIFYVLSDLGTRTPLEIGAVSGAVLCVIAIAYLVLPAQNDSTRLLGNLRFVVPISILAVSFMVFLLRGLQGDYYLLYLLPLVSAAGYLGFAGGLFAGIASAAAYTVIFFLSPVSFAPGSLSALLLRALVFVLVASLLGLIAERHLSLLTALRASHTQALQLAMTDTRTGLFNAGYLQSRLRSEISRAQRSHTPLSFLVIDVAGLEKINHEHGRTTGDAVLSSLGRIIQKQLRATDIPSRWGEDEFGVLLYNSDVKGAEIVARRIAAQVAAESFSDPKTKNPFHVSVFEGIAAFPAHTEDKTGDELVDRAHRAMQRATPENPVTVWSA